MHVIYTAQKFAILAGSHLGRNEFPLNFRRPHRHYEIHGLDLKKP